MVISGHHEWYIYYNEESSRAYSDIQRRYKNRSLVDKRTICERNQYVYEINSYMYDGLMSQMRGG